MVFDNDRNVLAVLSAFVVALVTVACGGLPDHPVAPPPMPEGGGGAVPLGDDPVHAFDFWRGTWDVQNLHLQRGGSWKDTGTAVARIQAVAGGNAILEQWNGEARGRLIGSSIRAWNPDAQRWDVYLNWHTGEPTGFSVMHARRDGESLHLYPSDGSRSPRYTFSQARAESCQWSLANDLGSDRWRTEWVMQFVRSGPPAHANAASMGVRQPPQAASRFAETRQLDHLLGTWHGTVRRRQADGGWEAGTASAVVTSMIEGFALLQFIDTSFGQELFAALGFDTYVNGWVSIQADSERVGLQRLVGTVSPEDATFASASTRERWAMQSDATARWELEVADGDQGWQPLLVATFRREE